MKTFLAMIMTMAACGSTQPDKQEKKTLRSPNERDHYRVSTPRPTPRPELQQPWDQSEPIRGTWYLCKCSVPKFGWTEGICQIYRTYYQYRITIDAQPTWLPAHMCRIIF